MLIFAAEMSKLFIFNPEHDIALASNLSNFTAPHAGRQLRADLGFLQALWADDGDAVLVDHVDYAEKIWHRLAKRLAIAKNPVFLPRQQQLTHSAFNDISPWGWDKALVAELKRRGADSSLLPDTAQLNHIQQLSHRRTAAALLTRLETEGTVGEAYECTQGDEVEQLLARYKQVVMKAPWSSSGRGIRFLSTDHTPFQTQASWFRHVVERQGSVMVEPFYRKVKDFGMEFVADGNGSVHYEGLSIFHTINGAYVGNILATEATKLQMISRYIPICLLEDIKQKIISCVDLGRYQGPFGIDMMIVSNSDQFPTHNSPLYLHPCVELNLRRTMGHVALSLMPQDDDIVKVMRIELTDNYKLKIRKL